MNKIINLVLEKGFIYTLFFIVLLSLSFSFISAGTLRVTEEHPFLINDEWISASQLEVGDLLTTIDGKKVRITNLEDVVSEEPFSVYNLEAREYSNFAVNSEGVIVHNSKLISPLSYPSLTRSKLITLLRKPGGSLESATLQADDALNLIDMSQPYKDNFLVAVRAHLKTTQEYTPKEVDVKIFSDVIDHVTSGNGRAVSDAITRFKSEGRFSQEYWAIKKNFFPSVSSGETKVTSSYSIIKAGQPQTVNVEYILTYKDETITLWCQGGVNTGDIFSSRIDNALQLLDDLKVKAITSQKLADRARAVAEFEWVHAATCPSVKGGGTVLAMVDYPLLDKAGFKITEETFRRVETEAITMPREDWLFYRTMELIKRAK